MFWHSQKNTPPSPSTTLVPASIPEAQEPDDFVPLELLEHLPANVMYCDRDLILRYINGSSRKTLEGLQQYLPIPVREMIGRSIHIFHKQPQLAEDVLGGANSGHEGKHHLPHRAVIQLGPEKLDLMIEAVRNSRGEYVGAVVVWGVTTAQLEKVRAEGEQLRSHVAEIDRQLQLVCTATNEITISTGEISKNAFDLQRMAESSNQAGEQGLEAIHSLRSSSNGVEQVADLIHSIATQTSVLALNATIEAARAGVHGKGFSVVAGEVKKLSEQTTKATEEIQAKITAIRADLERTTSAISLITQDVGTMTKISQMLAAATEEQKAATQEMLHNMEIAAQQTSELAHLSNQKAGQDGSAGDHRYR